MKKELTCIVCPMGCRISVNKNKSEITVSGNTCKRGEKYAISECINPERIVTTTVRTADNKILSVKTSKPIPKELIFTCMEAINKLRPNIKNDDCIGQVVYENIINTGADIVITRGKR